MTFSLVIMRHKTITLCPTTYEISRKIPNFSKWIRDKLLEYNKKAVSTTIKEKTMRCNTCYDFVDATWELFIDGTEAWFGHCETCGVDKTWTPKVR